MARPFVALDGWDAAGVRAEVWVQTGTGTISEITHRDDESKANVVVRIKSSHDKVTHPIKGWLGKNDPIYPQVVAAYEAGREITYRIEAQRKPHIDRTIPIKELRDTLDKARESTVVIFAGIDGTLSSEAVTNPAEDPAPGGRVRAIDTPATPAQTATLTADQALMLLGVAVMHGGVIDVWKSLALAAGATPEQVDAIVNGTQATPNRGATRRAYATEASPYVEFNSDGRQNLGSFAVAGAFAAERVANTLLADQAQKAFEAYNAAVEAGEIEGEVKEAPDPVNLAQAASLAAVLLRLADRVQVGAYGGGRPNRIASSHSRARSLVFDAVLNRHPVPFGAPEPERQAWMDAVVNECVERYKRLAEIAAQPIDVEQTNTQQPQTAPAEAQPGQAEAQVERQQPARPPVEGQEGFQAPQPQVIARFGALATNAGFEAKPNSPVVAYLRDKFGVGLARQVHGPALEALVSWYERQGEQASAKFREHVLSAAKVAA